MNLLALQRDLRAWLVGPDDLTAASLGPDSASGLRVYRNNYRAQLSACLEETFARTRDWIGGDAFQAAVIAHIERVPPSSWTLDAYPRDFPETLATLYPVDAEVTELAWLDWALGEAFVGPDVVPITATDLLSVDWDRAILRFAPTLDVAELTTNSTSIWSRLAAGQVPPAVELLPEPGAILVWRQGLVAQFRAIDGHEHRALLSARAGMPFACLCDAMVATWGETEGIARAGGLLGRWVNDGLIVATA